MSRVKQHAYIPVALLALGLIFGGTYAVHRGNQARNDISTGLAREHVTVSADAPAKALRNKPVDSAATAKAEADAIWMHTMKATANKTYAQLKKDDPARATAKDGAFLRTGLMLSVASFGVAELVVGIGWGFILLGLFALFFGVPVAAAARH